MDLYSFCQNIMSSNAYYSNNPQYVDAKEFDEFPVLTKEQVLLHKDVFSPPNPSLYTTYTSGSTGMPLRVSWKREDYLKSIACLWRLRGKNQISVTDIYLTCHNTWLFNGELQTAPVIVGKNFLSVSKIQYTRELINEYIKYIEVFTPTWIYAQPSFVYHFGLLLKELAPNLLKMFKYVELVGEMVTPEIKKAIATIFPNAKVVSMYGMQEFNCIMYEDDGLLFPCEGNVYVEIVNEYGEVCQVGEEGDIIVTGLKNKSFPYIRYKTGDRGVKVTDGFRVGYVITQGRANDLFAYNGRVFDGSLFFCVILKYNLINDNEIVRFQVLQKGDSLLFLLFGKLSLSNQKQTIKQLKRILKEDFNVDCELQIQIVSDYSSFLSSTGKTKYFVNCNG